jgi:hypothetical protein
MNSPLPKEERFKPGEPCRDADGYLIADTYVTGHFVTIYEADLTPTDARKLRDWLNRVLP